MDEKPNKYENLPIPTYEEATSSRPVSSQSRIGPEEVSDDAERQGLLGRSSRNTDASRRGNYEPPTVESERSSLDTLDGIDTGSDDGEVRREMQQMELEDPDSDNGSHRSLLTYRFKRLTSFTSSLPSFKIPSIRGILPSVRWPKIDWAAMDTSRVVILGRLFGVALIMGVVYILIASNVLTIGRARMGGAVYDPEIIREVVQSGFRDPTHIGRHLRHLTKYPHLAGTEGSYVLAEYIAEKFKEAGLEDVDTERFDVYLNYPRNDGRRVAIVEPEDQKWEAKLEEDDEQVVVFHGHSKSGDVTGPLIYVNYGSRDDFRHLKDLGLWTPGAIALVRYFGTEPDRGLKVKAAYEAGAAGCIIYTDPGDGGLDGPKYPEGRFMPDDGVQRGSVSLMSFVLGDVLSPGWASTPENKNRLKPEESEGLNKIPSIPISWRDAKHLLDSLKGHGDHVYDEWTGVPDQEYWTGDKTSPKVNLRNLQDEETYQPIYNVIGRLTGWVEPEKKVIIGNHRDAWCLGGADPGSGTAIMLHMAAIFGSLVMQGWRPLRTIEFASWDGEEYNMVGSTEHVENRLKELRDNGLVYVNCDMGAYGTNFEANASPVFNQALRHALHRVLDPGSNKTMRDLWDEQQGEIKPLGGGSDFMAFQDFVGTSAIDLSFGGGSFPYHSCYDNFDWMDRFGDPTWEYSAVLGQIMSLIVLEYADNPLMPFDIGGYASRLDSWITELERETNEYSNKLDFLPLYHAVTALKESANSIEEFDSYWASTVFSNNGMEAGLISAKRHDRNQRLARFETNMLDLNEGGGLVNRTQYKHTIFAPATWGGYTAYVFPSIRQWLDIGDWDKMQEEIHNVANRLNSAAQELAVIR